MASRLSGGVMAGTLQPEDMIRLPDGPVPDQRKTGVLSGFFPSRAIIILSYDLILPLAPVVSQKHPPRGRLEG